MHCARTALWGEPPSPPHGWGGEAGEAERAPMATAVAWSWRRARVAGRPLRDRASLVLAPSSLEPLAPSRPVEAAAYGELRPGQHPKARAACSVRAQGAAVTQTP